MAMRESMIQRQSFEVVVQVDLQVLQADGLSWDVKGVCESVENVISE